MFKFLFCLLFTVYGSLFTACGNVEEFDVTVPSMLSPYVHRVDPANGGAGDIITIYGWGFSTEPANNIVSFGGASTVATDYGVLATPADGELETLTVTVPAGSAAGDAAVYVTVFDNISNANLTFTITP